MTGAMEGTLHMLLGVTEYQMGPSGPRCRQMFSNDMLPEGNAGNRLFLDWPIVT